MRSLARTLLVLALLPFVVLAVAVLHAQDSTVVVSSGGTSPFGALAYAILLPVAAWISAKLYDGFKTIIPMYDRLPALVHQVAAPVFQFLFGAVASGTGAALLTDIHAIDAAWIGGFLNALLAAGLKRYEKSRAPQDTTAVLEASRASNGVQGVR